MRPRIDRRRSFRPLLEALEGRALPSICLVDRLTDLGEGKEFVGDLRHCIGRVQDGDSIQFAVKGTINLTRALPDLARSVSIEGPGADLLTVRRNAGGSYRIFTVAPDATVTISGMTLTNGDAAEGCSPMGGGILNRGTLTVSHGTLTENSAHSFCGPGLPGRGGGIYNVGTLTISHSTVSGNGTDGEGGGIYNAGTLTVSYSTLSGNRTDLGGGIYNAGDAVVSHSAVLGNDRSGIHNARAALVSHSVVSGHTSGTGILNLGVAATLTVSHSTMSGNTNGGIYNTGTAVVSHSTVSGNTGPGGVWSFGILVVSNSTVSGNQSSCSFCARMAGGIRNTSTSASPALAWVVNSTVADNTAFSADRSGDQFYTGRLNEPSSPAVVWLRNTIVSGDGERPNFFAGEDGAFVSEGHNLSNDGTGDLDPALGDLPNTDTLLGPLEDNGGPTLTHALLPGSPAIDAGDNTDAPETDQRGLPRVTGNVLDIGAFEVQPGPAAFFYLAAPETAVAGVPFDLLVLAFDADGYLATTYTGTVAFYSATDPDAVVPDAYTFTAADAGVVYLPESAVLYAEGPQEVWAYDVETFAVGLAVVEVLPGDGPNPFWGYRPDAAALCAFLLSEPARMRP